MPVDLVEVDSSNIAKIGYDPETQKLYVKFKSGALWSYAPVPPEKYREMEEAALVGKSVGKFFSREIRSNKTYIAMEVVMETEKEGTS